MICARALSVLRDVQFGRMYYFAVQDFCADILCAEVRSFVKNLWHSKKSSTFAAVYWLNRRVRVAI